ncbi:MAG: SDR family NAD(P)-dependent oxidoreductase, partial [Sulfuritalea sp.]|nr:SDR family NAD(P)-dependent oxidoreductase [Sulfuritalea sp.]
MKISGKTAVVTGGASGIGKATAEALAEAGAHVIIGDLDAANGEAVAASIRARGQGADYLRLDVADLASVAEF